MRKKRQKKKKFKGFGQPPPKKTLQFECQENGEWGRILEEEDSLVSSQLELVESRTRENQKRPSALKEFQELVEEGKREKLVEYFQQYGIKPNIARLNLESLIAEELRDLAGSKENV